MLESGAFEILHGDEGLAVCFADVMNSADVGMVQRGCSLRFALEAGESLRIGSNLVGQELECDETTQASIFRFNERTSQTRRKPREIPISSFVVQQQGKALPSGRTPPTVARLRAHGCSWPQIAGS